MANKLPKHLQVVIDSAMKTNKGRNTLGKLTKASYFRSTEGKIKKVK